MRRDNLEARVRVVLGPRALALASEANTTDEAPTAEHLEYGIERLQVKVAAEARLNAVLQQSIDSITKAVTAANQTNIVANRGSIMMVGQMVRELHMFRQILVLLSAPKSEAQYLLEHALKPIVEMRKTLLNWRDREGIEIPNTTPRKRRSSSTASCRLARTTIPNRSAAQPSTASPKASRSSDDTSRPAPKTPL